MKSVSSVTAVFIYVVSAFGAVDILTGVLKPAPEFVLFVTGIFAFGMPLFCQKRLLVADILMVIFSLISAMGFSLFVSDLIFPPVSVADDCLGHLPSRIHFFDIVLVGLVIMTVCGYIFIKYYRENTTRDRVLLVIVLIILILSYSGAGFIQRLNKTIDKISNPEYVLPKGC